MHEDGLPLPQRRYAIAVTALGTLMAMMDATIANVALPTIARELGTTASASIWIVNAYQFALTMLIVPCAALSDIVGYARVYRVGLAIFCLGSLACALSHTLLALALARVLQGIGGAAMTSTIGSLNRHAYPSAMLGRAAGQGALMVAVGAAAGPIVGGAVLAVAPWPWLFAINLPFGLLAFAFSVRALPRVPGSGARFDWPSALLSAATFGALTATIEAAGHHAAATWSVLCAAVTLAAGVVFVRRQQRLVTPLFAVDLLARPHFALSLASSVTSFAAQTIAYVALPFLFQGVFGRSPFETGLLLLPWLVAAGIMAPIAGRLSDRFSAGALGAFGMLGMGAGLLALMRLPAHAATADIVWRTALCGIGYGFFQSPNNRTILGAVPRARSGAAQGMLATARLGGQTLGAALVALLFTSGITATHVTLPEVDRALALAAAFALAAAAASVLRRVPQSAA